MVEVFGLSAETPPGPLARVVAADAEDPYRMAGQVLAIPDAERGLPDADRGRIDGGERCVPAVG
ncbi:hypothetical protein AB0G77_40275 [Streptomyces hygroscopicus]|uniref:hypothetical protein n=1 Tax=Streptomyces hygroscopicus TaxID=1912 RepID=UPI0033D742FD